MVWVLWFDNEHANQGSQCSVVPTYTFVVDNIALYQLVDTQDNFACSLSKFLIVYNAVLSVSVCVCVIFTPDTVVGARREICHMIIGSGVRLITYYTSGSKGSFRS